MCGMDVPETAAWPHLALPLLQMCWISWFKSLRRSWFESHEMNFMHSLFFPSSTPSPLTHTLCSLFCCLPFNCHSVLSVPSFVCPGVPTVLSIICLLIICHGVWSVLLPVLLSALFYYLSWWFCHQFRCSHWSTICPGVLSSVLVSYWSISCPAAPSVLPVICPVASSALLPVLVCLICYLCLLSWCSVFSLLLSWCLHHYLYCLWLCLVCFNIISWSLLLSQLS